MRRRLLVSSSCDALLASTTPAKPSSSSALQRTPANHVVYGRPAASHMQVCVDAPSISRARERLFSEEKEGLLQRIEELKDDIDSFRVATRPVPPAATSAK